MPHNVLTLKTWLDLHKIPDDATLVLVSEAVSVGDVAYVAEGSIETLMYDSEKNAVVMSTEE